MKRLIVRLLVKAIGEKRTFRLAMTLRRIKRRLGLALPAAPLPGESELPPPFGLGACPLSMAFARARVLPGHLTAADLERLYEIGRSARSVCWIGGGGEAGQARIMLYGGGATHVAVGLPESMNRTDLIVLQNGAALPDAVRRVAENSGIAIEMLSGTPVEDGRRRRLRSQLAAGGRIRVVILNDVCFQYGAGAATRRQVQSFLLAGWDVGVVSWERGFDTSFPHVSGTVPTGRWLGVHSLPDIHATAGLSEPQIIARVVSAVTALDPDFVLVGNIHGAGWPIDILPALRDEGLAVAAYMHDLHWVTGRCAYPGPCRAYVEGGCHAGCPTADQYPSIPRDEIGPAWARRADVFTGPDAIPLIANSDWTRDVALSRFGDAARIETVYLGLDHGLFAPLDKALAKRLLDVPADRPMVLLGSVNVSEERKGGPVLAELLASLGARDDLGVLIFGHNSDQLRSTRAFGLVREEHVMALIYNAADIFIGTAREEAFGQTVIEAAACGLPVVAFKAGGVVEATREGEAAILQSDFSAAAILEGIDRLIADPSLRQEMGAAGRRRVTECFTLQVQAQAWKAALERIF
jgi:glycosyltransferase involved in cell wall biosynthesis